MEIGKFIFMLHYFMNKYGKDSIVKCKEGNIVICNQYGVEQLIMNVDKDCPTY